MSFGSLPFAVYTDIPLPSSSTTPIIAPLWIRTSVQGPFSNVVYYRVITDMKSLTVISAVIMRLNVELDFQPLMAAIITWFFTSRSEVIFIVVNLFSHHVLH